LFISGWLFSIYLLIFSFISWSLLNFIHLFVFSLGLFNCLFMSSVRSNISFSVSSLSWLFLLLFFAIIYLIALPLHRCLDS
jgi:hypothetical protein